MGTLLNAENFFIGLLSEDRTMLEFPYYLDGDLDAVVQALSDADTQQKMGDVP